MLILVFILLAYFPFLKLLLQKRVAAKLTKSRKRKLRILKPKTDKDCPYCQAQIAGGETPETVCSKHVIAWSMRKGKRGRKKTVCTEGYFCANPKCYYYLSDDETIHALVGYGSHGLYEAIPDLRCQFCVKKFSVRRNTVLYRLKTLSSTVGNVLLALAVGVDISTVEEMFGVREMTVRTWLARGGAHGQKLHQRFFANLELTHVQFDELWANVKQSEQETWVWTACDAKSKIIPVLQVGPRTLEMAYAMVHKLKCMLKPGCVPPFSSDGLKLYYYALTAHFGEWHKEQDQYKPTWQLLTDFAYAQVIKQQRRFRLVKVEHRMLCGQLSEYTARLKANGLSGNINTSYVERANLTIRQSVSKLTRRTWGPAQFTSELSEHLYWWLAYYHFARYHESLRVKLDKPIQRKGKQRPIEYRRMTPAVAAGLTTKRWSVMELISYPLP
jgi:IS1 family transposase